MFCQGQQFHMGYSGALSARGISSRARFLIVVPAVRAVGSGGAGLMLPAGPGVHLVDADGQVPAFGPLAIHPSSSKEKSSTASRLAVPGRSSDCKRIGVGVELDGAVRPGHPVLVGSLPRPAPAQIRSKTLSRPAASECHGRRSQLDIGGARGPRIQLPGRTLRRGRWPGGPPSNGRRQNTRRPKMLAGFQDNS